MPSGLHLADDFPGESHTSVRSGSENFGIGAVRKVSSVSEVTVTKDGEAGVH